MTSLDVNALALDKTAATSAPIHPLLAERWSPRAFQEGRAVEPEKILAVLEAARWAPSGGNSQTWRFIVWDRQRDAIAFEQAFETLGEQNKIWVKRAPVLIGVFSWPFRDSGEPAPSAAYDAGAAAFALSIQAEALGLSTHQMGGFDKAALKEKLQLPEELVAHTIIGLGYRAHPDVLHEKARLRELLVRERKPLTDTVFFDRWVEKTES
jgi:nitroreductase